MRLSSIDICCGFVSGECRTDTDPRYVMPSSSAAAIGALYEAVLAPAGWSGVLHDLARSVDAVGVVVFPPYAGEMSRSFRAMPASLDLAEPMSAFIHEGWWMDDHRARRVKPLLAKGRRVIVEHDIASDEDRKTMPVYQDFYRRFDVPWFAAAVFEADDVVWSATFLRSGSQGPFGQADEAKLLDLRFHLQHAVSLAVRTSFLLGAGFIELLDRFEAGAVVLDRCGQVTHANRMARAAFGAELDVVGGRLAARDPGVHCDLQRLVDGAIASPFSLAAARPVTIPRLEGRPLVVEAMPLAQGVVEDPFCMLRSIVLITDLDCAPALPTARLRHVFGFTNAETRLAVHIGSGVDIDEAAMILGITRHTARSQLKSIFSKTETHRQAELVALLMRLRG